MAVATAVRVYRLDRWSLWVDEAFSVWMAQHDPMALLRWVARIDQHPPLFYLLLAAWGRTWGWHEASLRGLSVALSVFTLPLMFAIGRRLGGTRVGWMAAVVFALSPLHVRYAREARMYALLTLGVALMVWAALHWLTAYSRGKPGLKWGGVVALGALITLYAHNMGLLFVLAFLAGAAWWIGRSGKRARWTPFLTVVAMIGVGWGIWVPVFIGQALGVLRRFWIPYPTWRSVLELIQAFHAAFVPRGGMLGVLDMLLLMAAFYGGWVIWQQPARRGLGMLLWSMVVVPVGLALAVSPVRPVFQVRTLIGASVPYLALATLGLHALPRKALRYAACALWIGLNLWGLVQLYRQPEPEPWRQVAAHVAEQVQPGDAILFHASWVYLPFTYYFSPDVPVTLRGIPADLFQRGELEPPMRPEDVPSLRALAKGYPRVWLIYSHDWYTDPQGRVVQTLDSTLCRVQEWRWPNIRVLLYVRLDAPCEQP